MQRFFRDFATFRNNPVHQPDFAATLHRSSLFRFTNGGLRFMSLHMAVLLKYVTFNFSAALFGLVKRGDGLPLLHSGK